MRPARSRRVQAQRKFAQGAYIPPNAVPVAAADNRRDNVQDARNVTVNSVSATSLLDVVSLQSAASPPERSGVHSHLKSLPVVLLERLRSRYPDPIGLSSSPRDTVQLRSRECHREYVIDHGGTIKIPTEKPKLQIEKNKKKDFKRVHAMALRTRRLSKLQLNQLIAKSCAPIKKATKRKNVDSDDDEPLIFQKTRKKICGHSIPSTFKETLAKPSVSCDKPLTKTITKKIITTDEINSKETKLTTAKQTILQKKSAKKSSPQKNNPKNRYPKQPAAPDFSITVIKEEHDVKCGLRGVNSEICPTVESVTSVVLSDPLASDAPVALIVPDAPIDPVPPIAQVVLTDPVPMIVSVAPIVPVDPIVSVAPTIPVYKKNPNALPDTITCELTPDVLSPLDDLPAHLEDLLISDDDSDKDDICLRYMESDDSDDEFEGRRRDRDGGHRGGRGDGLDDSDEGTYSPMMRLPFIKDMMIQSPISRQAMIARPGSPEPGPSGLQHPGPDAASSRIQAMLDREYLQDVLENTAVNLEQILEDPPQTPCVAVQWNTDQDVRNAPKQLLESRCKKCKPCIRIEKLMTVSAIIKTKIILTGTSIQDNNATAPVNAPIETEEGETAVVENEDNESGYLYLDVPNQSNIMLKLRTSKVHGKSLLGVSWKPRSQFKNKQEFSLEEQEHVLDELIETLKISRNIPTNEGRIDAAQTQVSNSNERPRLSPQPSSSESRNNNVERAKDLLEERRITILSDISFTPQPSTSHRVLDKIKPNIITAEKLKQLAEAKLMQDRINKGLEEESYSSDDSNTDESARGKLKKKKSTGKKKRKPRPKRQTKQERDLEIARLTQEIKTNLIAEVESLRLSVDLDKLAKTLAEEKDAKKMDSEGSSGSGRDGPGTSGEETAQEGGKMVDAPVYYPTVKEFDDPLLFYQKIWPEARRFGICKVVPPDGWKPPCKMSENVIFDVTNQHISRMFNRWGPAARELCAIKLCLEQHKIHITRPPLLGGVEINLPKLYRLVQRHGGLQTVINKKRWGKVAEEMKLNRLPYSKRKLNHIYLKYLLPYDTLSHQERQELMRKVEIAWNRKNQKLLDRAMQPLYRQHKLLGLLESSDDESEDEAAVALHNAEDCITEGKLMRRSKFKKIAAVAYEIFGRGAQAGKTPSLEAIEEHYWRHVAQANEHVCVHTAAIDTGEAGLGCPKDESKDGQHPWNPKMVSKNKLNVLRYLGPVLGSTVPTLLLGMLFSTSCWHKDPHSVGWLEFQHEGPPRVWYGIPEDQADNFRKAVETLCPTICQNKGLWLPTDISMIPPNVLREHNVTLSRVTQNAGEFILTFPNAYTCCISSGYTVSESVYFAPPACLTSMWQAFKETRASCEPTMFAMEHLLYNIGRDENADLELARVALPLYDRMLRDEVTNRQMLQERGLSFVQNSSDCTRDQNGPTTYSPRDQEECEYCRATLYLSKVKGLTGKDSLLCLEHALKLLDTDRYKNMNVSELQVVVHLSVKELNDVHDVMLRRLGVKGG